jgi:hypothetical protein
MYYLDALRESRSLHQQLQQDSPVISGDPEVTAKIAFYLANDRVAASGIVGGALYDMAHDSETAGRAPRNEVSLATSRLVLIQDLADTVVDLEIADNTDAKRVGFLRTGLAALADGQVSLNEYSSLRQRATLYVAKNLHDSMFGRDERPDSHAVIEGLASAGEAQLKATTPESQLSATRTLGAYCFESIALFTEIVDTTDYALVREAARHMGASAIMLDHLYDLEEDLQETTPTYPTLIIAEHGDTPQIRKDIKQELLAQIKLSNSAIFSELSPFQRKRYSQVMNIIGFKHKVGDFGRHIKIRKLKSVVPLKPSLTSTHQTPDFFNVTD